MSVNSVVPNTRYGATFLDVKYKDHAVEDEVMMRKKTGEILYKRNDGKFLWFEREEISPYEHFSQIKTRGESCGTFLVPTERNARYVNSYFLGTITSMLDFKFNTEEGAEEIGGLLTGYNLINPEPIPFSISQEANGFFINVGIAPRDRALVGMLSNRYNAEYYKYKGDDPDKKAKAKLYSQFNYLESHFVVNYTVTWYTPSGEVKAIETADGYVCANENSLIPFRRQKLYDRTVVNSAKLTINYISAPKLSEGLELLTTDSELEMLDSVKDSDDITVSTYTLGYFFTNTDDDIHMADEASHTSYIYSMGMDEYDAVIDRVGRASGSDVFVSPKEPTTKEWKRSNVWFEVMNTLTNIYDVRFTGNENTTMLSIEEALRGITRVPASISLDIENTEDFYVNKFGNEITEEDSKTGGE